MLVITPLLVTVCSVVNDKCAPIDPIFSSEYHTGFISSPIATIATIAIIIILCTTTYVISCLFITNK